MSDVKLWIFSDKEPECVKNMISDTSEMINLQSFRDKNIECLVDNYSIVDSLGINHVFVVVYPIEQTGFYNGLFNDKLYRFKYTIFAERFKSSDKNYLKMIFGKDSIFISICLYDDNKKDPTNNLIMLRL